MKVPDVIKDILQSGGLESGTDFKLSLNASYPVREYIVQYRETDLQFVTRLMEEVGIFYFFEHTEDGHVLVLGDDTGAHTDVGGPVVLPFRATDTGLQGETEEVTRLRLTRTMRTGKVSMRSFNFEKNKLKLDTASSSDAETMHEHYDFDGRYFDEAAGKELVKVRQEAFAARRRTLSGVSNSRHLTSGFKFGVSEHPRDDFNADYLLTRVVHTGEQPQAAGADSGDNDEERAETYTNTFEAIPAAVVFRPLQLTESALVDGPQTAVVTGPAGEEIYCDSHGRVKVQFHWDRYGTADDKASCWMRVAQSHRIADFAIPRIGEEVIVDFLEGDPDQPIITGRVYNGTNQTPYGLPGEKTKSTFRTPSSPGGNGFNELRFEDAAGSEEVFFHSQKDLNIKVLHNRTQDIGVDNTHHVGSNEVEEVGKNRTRKVGEDESVTIVKNETISIGENHTESVGKDMTLTVGDNLTESIGKDHSATIGGAQTVSVDKDDTLTVAKNQSITVTGDKTETVKGVVDQTVTGSVKLTFKDKLSHTITSDVSIKLDGKAAEKVATTKHVEAGDEIVLKCGSAKIVLKASGDIQIEGSSINIKGSGSVAIKGSTVAAN
jgi:type VI secretion system secreted protein VgrG